MQSELYFAIDLRGVEIELKHCPDWPGGTFGLTNKQNAIEKPKTCVLASPDSALIVNARPV